VDRYQERYRERLFERTVDQVLSLHQTGLTVNEILTSVRTEVNRRVRREAAAQRRRSRHSPLGTPWSPLAIDHPFELG
jgi:hypothetical protein